MEQNQQQRGGETTTEDENSDKESLKEEKENQVKYHIFKYPHIPYLLSPHISYLIIYPHIPYLLSPHISHIVIYLHIPYLLISYHHISSYPLSLISTYLILFYQGGGELGSPSPGGQHAPSPFSMLQAKLEQVSIPIFVTIVITNSVTNIITISIAIVTITLVIVSLLLLINDGDNLQLPRGPPMFPGPPPGFLASHGMENPLQVVISYIIMMMMMMVFVIIIYIILFV